jgi:hypothetical protein
MTRKWRFIIWVLVFLPFIAIGVSLGVRFWRNLTYPQFAQEQLKDPIRMIEFQPWAEIPGRTPKSPIIQITDKKTLESVRQSLMTAKPVDLESIIWEYPIPDMPMVIYLANGSKIHLLISYPFIHSGFNSINTPLMVREIPWKEGQRIQIAEGFYITWGSYTRTIVNNPFIEYFRHMYPSSAPVTSCSTSP